jgi:hypothetical protein
MGGEEGILPERSEWFRSSPVYRKLKGVDNRGLSVVACKQYSTDLQTKTFIGQRFVRIRQPVGQHSVQMGQHSCANGLQTRS